MNAIDVIKTELACVQRDCCRVENQCAKCDLVLPVEEIISAYEKCITVLSEHEELKKENAKLKEKLKPENCLKLLAKDGYVKFTSDQLTKAKNLLLRFIELKNKPCAVGHSVNMLLYENICAEAKQFLKEN